MNESLFQVKTCFSQESQGVTAESSWWLTISLLNYSPISALWLACLLQYKAKTVLVKDTPASRGALPVTPLCPLSPGTQLISGCLCHGLEMTGAGSPLPWQATAQITPLPERANALLMNNKSTLITNCQPNQLALQLSQTASLGTAARHYSAHWPV